MKKISNLLLVAIAAAMISFTSCNDVKPKDISMKSLNDSINYTLGHWQGDVFKQQYFADDTDGKQLEAFIKALDKAYSAAGGNEMYDLGLQVGKYIKDQTKNGFFGDSTLTGKEKLVLAGLINALNDYQEILSGEEADSIMQTVQMRVQEQQMMSVQSEDFN